MQVWTSDLINTFLYLSWDWEERGTMQNSPILFQKCPLKYHKLNMDMKNVLIEIFNI